MGNLPKLILPRPLLRLNSAVLTLAPECHAAAPEGTADPLAPPPEMTGRPDRNFHDGDYTAPGGLPAKLDGGINA